MSIGHRYVFFENALVHKSHIGRTPGEGTYGELKNTLVGELRTSGDSNLKILGERIRNSKGTWEDVDSRTEIVDPLRENTPYVGRLRLSWHDDQARFVEVFLRCYPDEPRSELESVKPVILVFHPLNVEVPQSWREFQHFRCGDFVRELDLETATENYRAIDAAVVAGKCFMVIWHERAMSRPRTAPDPGNEAEADKMKDQARAICDTAGKPEALVLFGNSSGIHNELVNDVVLVGVAAITLMTERNDASKILQDGEFVEWANASQEACRQRRDHSRTLVCGVNITVLWGVTREALIDINEHFENFGSVYRIFFCGHGERDGIFSLSEADLTGGEIYMTIYNSIRRMGYYPDTYLMFNCCYAEALIISALVAEARGTSTTLMNKIRPGISLLGTMFGHTMDEGEIQHIVDPETNHAEQGTTAELACNCATRDTIEWERVESVSYAGVPSKEIETIRTMKQKLSNDFFRRWRTIDGVETKSGSQGSGRIFLTPLGMGPMAPEGYLLRYLCSSDDDFEKVRTRFYSTLGTHDEQQFGVRMRPQPLATLDGEKKAAILTRIGHNHPQLFVMSLGSADSAFLCLPSSATTRFTMLLDGGMSYDANKWYNEFVGGLPKLDCLVVTHSDEDHIGGIYSLACALLMKTINLQAGNVLISAPGLRARDHSSVVDCVVKAFPNAISPVATIAGSPTPFKFGEFITMYVITPTQPQLQAVINALNSHDDGKFAHVYNDYGISLLIIWRDPAGVSLPISMLFTADVSYKHLLAGLQAVVLDDVDRGLIRSADGQYLFTYMDIPHHGSSKYFNDDDKEEHERFFEHVRALKYGWSGNGGLKRNSNPKVRGKHFTTMGDGVALKFIEANLSPEQLKKGIDIYYTFPEWLERNNGPDDDDSIIRHHHYPWTQSSVPIPL